MEKYRDDSMCWFPFSGKSELLPDLLPDGCQKCIEDSEENPETRIFILTGISNIGFQEDYYRKAGKRV